MLTGEERSEWVEGSIEGEGEKVVSVEDGGVEES